MNSQFPREVKMDAIEKPLEESWKKLIKTVFRPKGRRFMKNGQPVDSHIGVDALTTYTLAYVTHVTGWSTPMSHSIVRSASAFLDGESQDVVTGSTQSAVDLIMRHVLGIPADPLIQK